MSIGKREVRENFKQFSHFGHNSSVKEEKTLLLLDIRAQLHRLFIGGAN